MGICQNCNHPIEKDFDFQVIQANNRQEKLTHHNIIMLTEESTNKNINSIEGEESIKQQAFLEDSKRNSFHEQMAAFNKSPMRTKTNNCYNKKSDRKSKLDISYGFDYHEHSNLIFELFNNFRKNPMKYFKKLQKEKLITETDLAYLNSTYNQTFPSVTWSDEAYKILYKKDVRDCNLLFQDEEEIVKSLATLYDCDVIQFYLAGEYDPEMSLLILIHENLERLNLMLSQQYEYGTVCSYNSKPDIFFLYLIKVI
jgi:hypothetical protein